MILPLWTSPGPDAPRRAPIANRLLAALVVAVSVLSFAGLGAAATGVVIPQADPDVIFTVGGGPPSFSGVLDLLVLQRGARFHVTQLVGVALVHGDWAHLLGNVLLLLVLGGPVERRLGPWRFVGLWLALAAASALGWLAVGDGACAVGASGVVMGLLGACFVLDREARVHVLAHPLSWLVAVAVGAGLALFGPTGTTWALVAAVVLGWIGRTLLRWRDHPGVFDEGLLGRLLGFAVLRPRVGVVLAVLGGLDLVAWLVARGTGPLASIARDGVAHEAHVVGALAGLVGATLLRPWAAAEAPALAQPARAAFFRPVRRDPVALGALGAPGAQPTLDFEAWAASRPRTARRTARLAPGSRAQVASPAADSPAPTRRLPPPLPAPRSSRPTLRLAAPPAPAWTAT